MNVSISSIMADNYLLIEAAGKVDVEEYKALQERYYNEIVKYDITAIIVDESKMDLPDSLIAQNEIVEFFSEELPEEIKGWRIGVVLPFSYIHIAKYWERQANDSGYCGFKVFTSIEDACLFINT